MKYTILINQAGIADAGYADGRTDLTDWAIIEYIHAWQANPKATVRDGLVWVNYKHLIAEMPLLGLNTKQAVSNRIAKLRELGLIQIDHDSDKRTYAGLTGAVHGIINFKSDRQPNMQGVNSGVQGIHENGQGGVHENGHSADNQISTDNQYPKDIHTELPLPSPSSQNPPQTQNPRLAPKENIHAKPKPDYTAQFDQFWSAYGYKVAKPKAENAFRAALKEASLETILAGVKQYKASLVITGYSQAHPATWLRNKRWLDETTSETANGRKNYPNTASKQDRIEDALAAAKVEIAERWAGPPGADAPGGTVNGRIYGDECFRQDAGVIEGDYTVVSG